jgi:hypothetical protein
VEYLLSPIFIIPAFLSPLVNQHISNLVSPSQFLPP